MKLKFYSVVLAALTLMGAGSAKAEFKDIRIDLTNGNLLSESEIANQTPASFGVVVASDGSVSRVDATDASAAIVISGKFHSNEHGWANFSSTVAVDGPVKVSMGSCAWGGDVKITNAAGEQVGTFNTNNGACFHNDKAANIVSTIYKGGATTLTISGGSYTPYVAVETVDPSEIKEDAKVTFSLGEFAGAGEILPAGETVEVGKTFTIPANHTLYLDGKTLAGWTDGSKNYEIGEIVTVEGNMDLTPRFVDNTVTLADRTEPVTIKWNFRRDHGAPKVGWEGKSNCFWVAQAKIGTEVIDVKLPFSTSPGKFNNGNNTDWIQINAGTIFQVPSCKGAVISYESYNPTEKTTIDGVVVPANGSTTPSFTVASKSESVPLEIQDGSYFRYISTVLPVEAAAAGEKFDNAEASIHWDFRTVDSHVKAPVVTPEGAIGLTPFSFSEELTVVGPKGAKSPDETYYAFLVPNSGSLEWRVNPKKGVKFTPTKVSAKIRRFGTDGGLIDVIVRNEEGVSEILDTDLIPQRDKSKEEDKKGGEAKNCTSFEYAVPATLATEKGFMLSLSIHEITNKNIGVCDVKIEGIVDGQVQEVNVYSLAVASNPGEGGNISVYPAGTEFDEGTEVTLTAAKNFGYKFLNWTDADKKVVSEEPKFVYTVNADASLTANFEKLATYELAYGVKGGANAYQVQPVPAPTVVDGKNMYEAGTKVTLTATSNHVIQFTNWSNGESSSEIVVDMDSDKELIAEFSASDFLAGWDFYRRGSNGRVADFASEDNDAASLILRNAAGEMQGWLDKSNDSDPNTYEGRNAAVNWRTTGLGDFYWQTMVNAASFTDIHVVGGMLYNYNAYSRYNVEASLDNENWEPAGVVDISGAKKWTDYDVALPEKFNNSPAVYIRWIADKTSPVDGTKSDNDGISMSATFITGTARLVDDGTAPVLLSYVPEDKSSNASINGRVVLNFDEKVKMAEGAKAVISGGSKNVELEAEVTGKTVVFPYKNLAYGTDYRFSLPAGSVADLTDNKLADEIVISFTTRTRPAVEKAMFDFVVPDNGTFKEAIAAANSREDKTARYRIFVKKGYYELPWSETEVITKDGVSLPNPITYLNASNVSIIGEDRDATVVKNLLKDATEPGIAYPIEGLHNVTTLFISKKVDNTYIQDITLKNGLNDNTGRGEAIEDNGNKTICKNVTLWGYQDTYCSNNQSGRAYFEGGILRGRTDFLCGKGDVFYKDVTLQMCEKGGYLAVPSTSGKYGYVFKDCEIVGETDGINGNYTLGRPWGEGTPIAVYIDTKMTVQPSAIGWEEMGTGWPKRFAEYNSVTASGSVIDLSGRKTIFNKTHKNNPVLTAEEAASYSYENVMLGNDNWDPASIAELAPAPANVAIDGSVLTWDNSDYALCWAVCADGKVVAFTTEPVYNVDTTGDVVYSVRAANEMGGLSEAVVAGTTGIRDIVAEEEIVSTVHYNVQGIRVAPATKGVLIKVDTLRNGKTVTSKVVVR